MGEPESITALSKAILELMLDYGYTRRRLGELVAHFVVEAMKIREFNA